MADGMVGATEAKYARREAAVRLGEMVKADLMRGYPEITAELIFRDVLRNLDLSMKGELGDDTKLSSEADVIAYQAFLLREAKNSLLDEKRIIEVGNLAAHLQAVSDQKFLTKADPTELAARRTMQMNGLERTKSLLAVDVRRQGREHTDLEKQIQRIKMAIKFEECKKAKREASPHDNPFEDDEAHNDESQPHED